MRILYVPFFSSKNLGGCSIFNAMKVMLRGIVEQNEDAYVYYMVPSKTEAFDVSADAFLDHPRIEKIPVRGQVLQEDDLVYVASEIWDLFNVDTGKYAPDLILTDKQRVSLWIKMVVNNGIRSVKGNIPLMTMSQFQAGSDEMGDKAPYSDEFYYSQVLGWYAGWNLWQCPAHLQAALRLARKYGRPTVVDKIERRSHKGWCTLVSTDRLRPYLSVKKSREEIAIHFGSRLSSGYHYNEVFDDVDRLYKAGRPVRLKITSPSAGVGKPGGQAIKRMEWIGTNFDWVCPCPQEQYYEIAAGAHINIWIDKLQGPTLSLREQAYLGQIIVAPDTKPYRDLLPDYPFFYKDKAEKEKVLRYLVEHYWDDEVQDVILKYRKHIEDHHAIENEIGNIYDFMQRAVAETDHTGNTDAVLKDVFEEAGWPSRISLSELREMVKKYTRIGRDLNSNYSGTNRRNWMWGMKSLGYRDLCDGPEPVFEKDDND